MIAPKKTRRKKPKSTEKMGAAPNSKSPSTASSNNAAPNLTQNNEAALASPFMTWLLETAGRDDVVGDLAADVAGFPDMWPLGELAQIADYLHAHSAPHPVLAALGEAWLEWKSGQSPDLPRYEPRQPIASWSDALRHYVFMDDRCRQVVDLRDRGADLKELRLDKLYRFCLLDRQPGFTGGHE